MASSGSSTNDDAVLQVIFDPEAPTGSEELLTEEVEHNGDFENGHQELSEEVLRAKELEVAAVRAAEGGNVGDALELLNLAATEAPEYASVYNNRAQVYRLHNQVEAAVLDLDTAIALSIGRGKVAEQAYTQRGLIWRLRGENEKALEDFKAAAKLGNRFAQKQVVHMNPYAALCNHMLSEAIGKLKRGET